MSQKTKLLNLRVSDEFNDRLSRIAEVLDIPYSQIIREAVTEKLDKLTQQHPALREKTPIKRKRAA
jgi:predicted transcriptional regulator